jgi:hypothetical protein
MYLGKKNRKKPKKERKNKNHRNNMELTKFYDASCGGGRALSPQRSRLCLMAKKVVVVLTNAYMHRVMPGVSRGGEGWAVVDETCKQITNRKNKMKT